MMLLNKRRTVTPLVIMLLSTSFFHKSKGQLGFDIYGDSSRFDPKHSVTLDEDLCEYTAELEFDVQNANVPFPPIMPGPFDPGSCTFDDTSCEGQSCLVEVRNVYILDEQIQEVTGFNHVGFDWSPCGHPPLENFGKPHLNVHFFRITPEKRESLVCDMLNPFICKFPPIFNQSSVTGRNYFVVAKEAGSGLIANAPATHEYRLDSAVPGDGLHAWDQNASAPVADWLNPILITGLYGGGNTFWEPMIPYEFVSGDSNNFYEESTEYVSKTIVGLPSYWSMRYNPDSSVTTILIKGNAENCGQQKSGKSPIAVYDLGVLMLFGAAAYFF
jgi:hypothetical protein